MMDLLQDHREVNVVEGLAINLRILCHYSRRGMNSDRFQHYIEIVYYTFKNVLRTSTFLSSKLYINSKR